MVIQSVIDISPGQAFTKLIGDSATTEEMIILPVQAKMQAPIHWNRPFSQHKIRTLTIPQHLRQHGMVGVRVPDDEPEIAPRPSQRVSSRLLPSGPRLLPHSTYRAIPLRLAGFFLSSGTQCSASSTFNSGTANETLTGLAYPNGVLAQQGNSSSQLSIRLKQALSRRLERQRVTRVFVGIRSRPYLGPSSPRSERHFRSLYRDSRYTGASLYAGANGGELNAYKEWPSLIYEAEVQDSVPLSSDRLSLLACGVGLCGQERVNRCFGGSCGRGLSLYS
ncbi:hypothetical protein BP00DRAFT_415012 [Aspergillus indologenus CBS 114.80]|uniref:Uncharacterized protein n=1 Tax=Aspergillus indologenus CBS 114.80 TaxID=1450541 RepID=A0A2V5I5S1_9EURO|nr:hypothetical protein BP00DRAFT_415012 [Aspergillus indologenus CBS 114.80]